MKTSAFLMMILVQVTVTIITAYFLYRAITAPKRPEPDSYSENDEEPSPMDTEPLNDA